jgi:hypothetical protein
VNGTATVELLYVKRRAGIRWSGLTLRGTLASFGHRLECLGPIGTTRPRIRLKGWGPERQMYRRYFAEFQFRRTQLKFKGTIHRPES